MGFYIVFNSLGHIRMRYKPGTGEKLSFNSGLDVKASPVDPG